MAILHRRAFFVALWNVHKEYSDHGWPRVQCFETSTLLSDHQYSQTEWMHIMTMARLVLATKHAAICSHGKEGKCTVWRVLWCDKNALIIMSLPGSSQQRLGYWVRCTWWHCDGNCCMQCSVWPWWMNLLVTCNVTVSRDNYNQQQSDNSWSSWRGNKFAIVKRFRQTDQSSKFYHAWNFSSVVSWTCSCLTERVFICREYDLIIFKKNCVLQSFVSTFAKTVHPHYLADVKKLFKQYFVSFWFLKSTLGIPESSIFETCLAAVVLCLLTR